MPQTAYAGRTTVVRHAGVSGAYQSHPVHGPCQKLRKKHSKIVISGRIFIIQTTVGRINRKHHLIWHMTHYTPLMSPSDPLVAYKATCGSEGVMAWRTMCHMQIAWRFMLVLYLWMWVLSCRSRCCNTQGTPESWTWMCLVSCLQLHLPAHPPTCLYIRPNI